MHLPLAVEGGQSCARTSSCCTKQESRWNGSGAYKVPHDADSSAICELGCAALPVPGPAGILGCTTATGPSGGSSYTTLGPVVAAQSGSPAGHGSTHTAQEPSRVCCKQQQSPWVTAQKWLVGSLFWLSWSCSRQVAESCWAAWNSMLGTVTEWGEMGFPSHKAHRPPFVSPNKPSMFIVIPRIFIGLTAVLFSAYTLHWIT